MTEFDFLPDIPIDKSHTLHQLTARFQTVKDGLPELVRNSKDQYARLGVTEKEFRQIVVLVMRRSAFTGAYGSFSSLSAWGSRISSFLSGQQCSVLAKSSQVAHLVLRTRTGRWQTDFIPMGYKWAIRSPEVLGGDADGRLHWFETKDVLLRGV